jgi:hypothetical protein
MPVFLTGDFNAPAHTDWIETMVGARPFIRYAVEWPVSKEVNAAGFKDSWRTVHPDPRTHPGLTWWARRPPLPTYAPDENDAEDRIDFVWFAGPVDAVNSVIVGEAGVASVSVSVTPWPSDHRGVVSTFTVIPADTPPLISTSQRIYKLGDDVELVYHGLNGASIQAAKLQGDREIILLDESPANNDGRIQIHADRFSAGRYLVRTRHENNASMQKEFWVIDPSLAASVTVKGDAFAAGQGIPISWQNSPGNRNDYVSVVHPETGAASEGGLAWSYVGALPEGELVLDDSNAEWGWPLPPGKYVIRLMKDDGYESLAESSIFQIE